MVLAVVMVQAIFATIHIPMLLVAGHGWAEVVAILPQLFIMGVALAIIYLATGNLLIAVGAHALADAYMQIPRDASGFEDDFSYLYLALALVLHFVAHLPGRPSNVVDRPIPQSSQMRNMAAKTQ